MISSGGAVVDGTRASHVAPALSFPPHHPLYPTTVPEFLRPPLPPRYRHPAVAARTTLTKDEDDYSSYRLYPYPYPYPPYLYPLVRPLDFSYTSPPQSPLVNPQSANITRTAPAPLSSSSLSLTTTATTIGAAKEPLKSRLLRKRSRAGPSTSFARGSLIRLASGELRRVEEMRTEDFITSAESCPALRLDPSTVVRIDSPPDSPTAVLTLSYGQNRSQVTILLLSNLN
ncbi:hypothetical protein O3M35_011540 [Rhynocoris fuscipes]|uniref:AXH domain-containing protein n=1 Tax=Rhynocoris fuscipes TaxID=488301 RepID=A0AAW1D3B5_9HEMI